MAKEINNNKTSDKSTALAFVNVSVRDKNGVLHRIGGIALTAEQSEYMKNNNISAKVHQSLAKAIAEDKDVDYVISVWHPERITEEQDIEF